jgi:hypothetical protein
MIETDKFDDEEIHELSQLQGTIGWTLFLRWVKAHREKLLLEASSIGYPHTEEERKSQEELLYESVFVDRALESFKAQVKERKEQNAG